QAPEVAPDPDEAREGGDGAEVHLRQGAGPSVRANATGGTHVTSSPTSSAAPRVNKSFDGLFFRQQRLANGGNQFSVEPPDQSMCIGGNVVLESVNSVLRVFDTAGNPLTGVV